MQMTHTQYLQQSWEHAQWVERQADFFLSGDLVSMDIKIETPFDYKKTKAILAALCQDAAEQLEHALQLNAVQPNQA